MDPRMNQVERRCVLTHELVHIELGHRGCQPSAVERDVRAEAAYRLIRLEDLLSGSVWALGPSELADELWVTDMVLHDRLAGLTVGERAQLPEDVRRYAERIRR